MIEKEGGEGGSTVGRKDKRRQRRTVERRLRGLTHSRRRNTLTRYKFSNNNTPLKSLLALC